MGVRFSHPQPNRSRKAAVFSGHSAAGSAPGSGLGGRGFKSRCSDQETDAERHPSFLLPQERIPQTQRNQRNQRFQRFHGTPRNPRNQRFQRNHDFTVPYENHETNDFNEITISRPPTESRKQRFQRFHDTPRKARKQRFQRKQRNARKRGVSLFSLCMYQS